MFILMTATKLIGKPFHSHFYAHEKRGRRKIMFPGCVDYFHTLCISFLFAYFASENDKRFINKTITPINYQYRIDGTILSIFH